MRVSTPVDQQQLKMHTWMERMSSTPLGAFASQVPWTQAWANVAFWTAVLAMKVGRLPLKAQDADAACSVALLSLAACNYGVV